MRYRYRILGGTRAVREDGTDVPLGGARLRALLTALARAGGRAVRTDTLVAEVWAPEAGGEPPADGVAALQALVGRLRRALGRDAVASSQGGYRLVADRDDIDLFRFERLADEGARALADGDAGKAAGLLDDALALWQGPALADLPDGGGAAGVRAGARHLAARRARLEADLALGRADAALPAVGALAAEHPLDEPLQALHLRTLRAAGRPAEALAAYEEVRTTLADRLGTDPGPELRALHADLLAPPPVRPRGASGAGPAPHDTAPGRTEPAPGGEHAGAGYRRGGDHEGGPASDAYGGGAARRAGARDASGLAPGSRACGPGQADAYGEGPATGSAGSGRRSGSYGEGTGGTARDGSGGATAGRPGELPADAYGGRARAPQGRVAGPRGERPDSWPGPGLGTGTGGPAGEGPHTGTTPRTAAGEIGAAAPSAPSAPRGNLRARLTSFVGREAEVRGVAGELAGARLVTLTGPGGAGKTRLSQETAASLDGTWPDGVWFAELAPVRNPEDIAEAVLTALGGRETVIRTSTAEGLQAAAEFHARDPLGRLAERCAARRMLLVLDNCEHVIDAAATLVETLLVECPQVTVLATSREPLGVPGESVRPVEPLPDPVALQLLADRGASARPGFRVDDDPEACAEICRRLDGLPLAIELAAARLRALTPRRLADRLDDRFRLLTSGHRTVLPRQQTLRAVVDWSWDLLNEEERTVLRRLSVFSGGCALEQAEEVCGADGLEPRDIAPLLGSLVDKSLVVAAPEAEGAPASGMRYALLETIAEYAAERLDEAPGERAAMERRHLVAYRELARTTDPLLRGPAQRRTLDLLESEHDNVRTALRRAVAAGDEEEALCLVLSMNWFWQLRDHRADLRTWTLAVAAQGPDPFVAPVTPAVPLPQRCTDAPPPMAPEVLAEARRAVHLMSLTDFDVHGDSTSPERRARMRGVLEAYEPGMPQTCRLPGTMWMFAWMFTWGMDRLPELLEATVEGCRAHGYDWDLAFVLQLRAKILNEQPDQLDQAEHDCDESLEIFRRLGDSWGMAEALAGRGEALCERGRFAEAAADYRQAIDCATRLGAESQVPLLLSRLGVALVESSDPAEVSEGDVLLREACEQRERQGGPHFAGVQYAIRLARKGETEQALALLLPLEEEYRRKAPELFCGMVQSVIAWLLCLDGEYEQALAKVREAIGRTGGTVAAVVAPALTVMQFLTAARVLASLGGGERGARLIGAYDVQRKGVTGRRTTNAFEREIRDAAEAAAREALAGEPGGYERAYAEGGGLSVEEATALVHAPVD